MIVVLGFLLSSLAAYLAIEKCLKLRIVGLKIVLSIWVAAVFSSIAFCVFLFTGIGFLGFNVFLTLFPAVLLVLAFKKYNYRFVPSRVESFPTFQLLVILAGLVYFSKRFFENSVRWGEWDSWAIWTQHAKFLGSEDSFANLFTNYISWTHPDYPLFLPSLVAIFWQASYSAFVPAIIGYLVALSLLIAVLTAFLEKGHAFFGLLLFMVLSTSEVLFPFITSQCADTLTALFILLPFVLLDNKSKNNHNAFLFLAGFFAASSGWVKNEGLAFFAIFSICFAIRYFRQLNFIKWYGLGTVLPLLMIVVFKLCYAPANDLINGNDTSYLDRLGDTSRYSLILNYMFTYIKDNCELLYYSMGIILLLRYRFYFSFGFVVIFLLFSSYFYAYVISPNDLTWHLTTSFARLIHQLFPVLLYLIFLAAANKFSGPTGMRFQFMKV